MNKGIAVLISGPSGVGKGTICKHLKADTDLDVGVTISCTTRPPRENDGIMEQDGVEYYFITEEEFEKRIAEGYFAEYNKTNSGFYYGTPKSEIERITSTGKNVIFEIEINGGTQLIQQGLVDCSIFIEATLDIIEERIRSRGELPEADIQARLETAKDELSRKGIYQHIVDNSNEVEIAVSKCKQLILETIKNNQA